ncbi:hypothetical protein [Anaerotruncus rubiinfantis]|uniref:hypothetical protein n=1 Tax=Anaerotruncus rubiinfantis TaxID=1720200 RepID=UPI00082993C5|nr:hypothetical protein [Anaerotruncus rubiinfantis]
MDMQQLVEEIAARVKERMDCEFVEQAPPAECGHRTEKQVLVANRKGCGACGACCRTKGAMWGSRIVCMQSGFEKLPDADTKAIVALHLTELDLLKIAAGVASDAYTEILVSGLLQGIPIFVPLEYAEFSSCASASAKRYRAMLEEKRSFLEACGVRFLPEEEVLACLNADGKKEEGQPADPSGDRTGKNKRKRLLTECRIKEAEQHGQIQIVIGRNTIVTDLAKEYAYKHGMELVYRQ